MRWLYERPKELVLKVLGVSIIFGFFAGWIAVFGAINELRGMREVKGWPARQGIITHSYARQVRIFKNRKFWDVEIAGVYVGTEERFNIGRLGYGIEQSVGTRGRADRIAARYPVDTLLTVYHKPGKPLQAILVRGNSSKPTWIALGGGLAMGLLPLVLYGYGCLRRRL